MPNTQYNTRLNTLNSDIDDMHRDIVQKTKIIKSEKCVTKDGVRTCILEPLIKKLNDSIMLGELSLS